MPRELPALLRAVPVALLALLPLPLHGGDAGWRALHHAGLGQGTGVCSGDPGARLCFGLRCAEGAGAVGAAWFLLAETGLPGRSEPGYVGLEVVGGASHRLTMRRSAAQDLGSLVETPFDVEAQADLLADLSSGSWVRPRSGGVVLGALPLEGAGKQIPHVLSLCAGPDGRH